MRLVHHDKNRIIIVYDDDDPTNVPELNEKIVKQIITPEGSTFETRKLRLIQKGKRAEIVDLPGKASLDLRDFLIVNRTFAKIFKHPFESKGLKEREE